MAHKTGRELNILRQALLDCCQEPKTAQELSKEFDETYASIRQVMDTLSRDGYLETLYKTCDGARRKFYKTLIDHYTPAIKVSREDMPLVKHNLSPSGRYIPMRHTKADRVSSKYHVGISPIYENG